VKPPAVVQYAKRPLSTVQPVASLNREAVDGRAESLSSSTDDGTLRRTILPGLVVGDPKNLGSGLALDEVDGTPKDEPAIDGDRIRAAAWIVTGLPWQAERKLEKPWLPLRARGQLVNPDTKIRSHARDLVLPDSVDGRREALVVVRRDARASVFVQRF